MRAIEPGDPSLPNVLREIVALFDSDRSGDLKAGELRSLVRHIYPDADERTRNSIMDRMGWAPEFHPSVSVPELEEALVSLRSHSTSSLDLARPAHDGEGDGEDEAAGDGRR